MDRDYRRWYSSHLGREMELLCFGHAGLPVLVFPSSQGRFYEFEDQGMVAAIAGKLDAGQVQLFCVDSIDAESWYNMRVPPRWRIARQMQYQDYVMREVLPFVQARNGHPLNRSRPMITAGVSFGAYHAANLAWRYPDRFTGLLSMGGAFDVSNFLRGYYDEDAYLNLPTHYLPNLTDPWYLNLYRQSSYVLATGDWDICLGANERMAAILRKKGIPVDLAVWRERSLHDWPEWRRMLAHYL